MRERSEAIVVASQKNTDKNVAEMLNLAITRVSLMDEADGKVKKFLAWVRPNRKDELVRRSEKSIAIASKYDRD